MAIGYAAFYASFNVEGHATIKGNWGVRISKNDSTCQFYSEFYSIDYEEIPCDEEEGELDMCASLNIEEELDADVHAMLQQPGDTVSCKIYYENYGTYDVYLYNIFEILPHGASNWRRVSNGEVYKDGVIIYQVSSWDESDSAILRAGTKNYIQIDISYDSEVTTQPFERGYGVTLWFAVKTSVSQLMED